VRNRSSKGCQVGMDKEIGWLAVKLQSMTRNFFN